MSPTAACSEKSQWESNVNRDEDVKLEGISIYKRIMNVQRNRAFIQTEALAGEEHSYSLATLSSSRTSL